MFTICIPVAVNTPVVVRRVVYIVRGIDVVIVCICVCVRATAARTCVCVCVCVWNIQEIKYNMQTQLPGCLFYPDDVSYRTMPACRHACRHLPACMHAGTYLHACMQASTPACRGARARVSRSDERWTNKNVNDNMA